MSIAFLNEPLEITAKNGEHEFRHSAPMGEKLSRSQSYLNPLALYNVSEVRCVLAVNPRSIVKSILLV